MDFTGKTREQLQTLIERASEHLDVLTQIWEAEQRRAWAARELERLAGEVGEFTEMPEEGYMPGAVVKTDDGIAVNVSGTYLDYGPLDTPRSGWELQAPEPGNPDGEDQEDLDDFEGEDSDEGEPGGETPEEPEPEVPVS